MSKDTKHINDIFHGRIFRIPDYQRGYAWEEKHRQAFWEDLELLLDIKGETKHYTGLIALESLTRDRALKILPEDDHWLLSGKNELCLVVDGQQRLTTLIIFIHELLRRHSELQPSEKTALNPTTSRLDAEKTYIRKESLAVPGRYGYTFGYANNVELDSFFKAEILDDAGQITVGTPTSAYARQLSKAKDFFRKKFQSFNSPEKLAVWFELVESRLLFNVFEVEDEFDVCLTFEAMNNRGKALSDLEKLKSRVLYLAGLTAAKDTDIDNRDQRLAIYRKVINESWKKTYELLGWNEALVLEDDAFLDLAWILRYGKPGESRDRHLFLELFTPKSAISSDIWPQIETFSSDLAALSAPWVVVKMPEQADSLHKVGLLKRGIPSDLLSWLERLSHINSTNFIPLIVAGMVHFQKDAIEKQALLRLIQVIERYVFMVFGLSERPSHTGKNVYMRKASQLYQNAATIDEIIVQIEQEISWRYQSDLVIAAVKSRQAIGGNQEGFYKWDYLKYALYEYEMHLHKERFKHEGAKVSLKLVMQHNELAQSIEHIFPQKPIDGEWPSFDELSTQERILLRNSLGNLLLLSGPKNSSLQNDAYLKKAKEGNTCYANGSFSEMAVASDFLNWTHLEIYARTENLLSFIGTHWRISDWEITKDLMLKPLEKFKEQVSQ